MTMTTSRRAILAGAASLPALALPAIATAVAADPIFAAIEAHRDLEQAFFALCHREEAMEEAGVVLEPAPGDFRTLEMIATVNAGITARTVLATTAPTTLAGLVALLDFVVSEYERSNEEVMVFDGDDETMDFVRSLARGTRAMAVQS
jgi:hypothetical protein